MNWINAKLIFINIFIFFILYLCISSVFYYLNKNSMKNKSNRMYTVNTIRATYPNYNDFNKSTALDIFNEYANVKTEYKPYIGYRRKTYNGNAVNIEEEYGFRLSTNHQIDDSIWFLGGSTLWGTGSTDDSTIPSYFAKITNENVLNFGETGWNSYQNFIQLQMMLIKGYKPKRVIFYSGGVDGYRYCTKDTDFISHGQTQKFKQYIESYKSLEKSLKKIKNSSNNECKFSSLYNSMYRKMKNFLNSPYIYFAKNKDQTTNNLKTDKKFNSFGKKNSYLICENIENAKKAANTTVEVWLLTFKLLKEYNIPVLFVLEPAATYKPEQYNLDYLLNTVKQSIVDETDSRTNYINSINNIWSDKCIKYNICSDLLDLTQNIFDKNDAIFIDERHISPSGNKIVAEQIAKKLKIRSGK
ncbi:hypothetical protein [Sulfurimonas sp.]|uniref:hypothetical protein n=1 Tax=Sulfurimonas sp. TaxID=2022749 RepID=UPI00356464F4